MVQPSISHLSGGRRGAAPSASLAVRRITLALAVLAALFAAGSPPSRSQVLPGIDVLVRDDFRGLEGKRVGLVINQSLEDMKFADILEELQLGDKDELIAIAH